MPSISAKLTTTFSERRGNIRPSRRYTNCLQSASVSETIFDSEFRRGAGRVKAMHRRVSLADCCALTLAKRLNGAVVTTDRHELEPLMNVGEWNITFVR